VKGYSVRFKIGSQTVPRVDRVYTAGHTKPHPDPLSKYGEGEKSRVAQASSLWCCETTDE